MSDDCEFMWETGSEITDLHVCRMGAGHYIDLTGGDHRCACGEEI